MFPIHSLNQITSSSSSLVVSLHVYRTKSTCNVRAMQSVKKQHSVDKVAKLREVVREPFDWKIIKGTHCLGDVIWPHMVICKIVQDILLLSPQVSLIPPFFTLMQNDFFIFLFLLFGYQHVEDTSFTHKTKKFLN
jgi:hypothetical protein